MIVENEVKVRLSEKNFQRVSSLLGPAKYYSQKNKFYSLPNGFLRLRTENENSFLTFKGKSLEAKFKACEEIEFKFPEDSEKKLTTFIERLGLKFILEYTKTRASYIFPDCVICLDILSNGNKYLEIEGEDQVIQEKMSFFGLSSFDIEKKSYFTMFCGGKNDRL